MKPGIITAIVLVCSLNGWSQTVECKVGIPEISGTYSGDCKNGLAHGKGIAQGVDKYDGHFRKGLPHGEGTYTWAGGKYYNGFWKNGKKDGEGKLVENGVITSGVWKDDAYIGEKVIPPYEITRNVNVTRYSLIKFENAFEEIKIKLLRGGVENAGIIEAYVTQSSGEDFRDGSVYGIQNPKFPLDVKIRFTATSALGTTRFDVFFDFRINEPGSWDVRVSY